jgi:hypothetical protein
MNCPRTLNINALPAFFGAATILSKLVSQVEPKPYPDCQAIQLENCIGRELSVGTDASGLHQSVLAYSTATVSVSNRTSLSPLSFSVKGYKPIHDIAIPDYQLMMLPLIRHHKRSGPTRGRKASVSGFRYRAA